MNVGIPQFTIPPVDPRTGQWNKTWWLFFQDLWLRQGGAQGTSTADLNLNDVDLDIGSISADMETTADGLTETNINVQLAVESPDISKLSSALNDANTLIRSLAVDDGLTSQQAALISKIVDLSLILDEAQDIAKKLRQAINDTVIDEMTPLDPIRSMAYQDASHVAIKGGSIDGTPIGAITASPASFTTVSASDQVTATKSFSVAPALKATTTATNQASTFAATNSDLSQFLVGYSGSSGDPSAAIWWKAGTTLRFATATNVGSVGFTQRASLDANGLVVTAGFGCNGKTAQTAYSLGADATDLASVITLANNLRAMSINNGIGA